MEALRPSIEVSDTFKSYQRHIESTTEKNSFYLIVYIFGYRNKNQSGKEASKWKVCYLTELKNYLCHNN